MATAKKAVAEPEVDESAEVEVPFGDDASETATLLLAAAEDLDLEPSVVRTSSDQTFWAPAGVVEKAGVKPKETSE